MWAVFLAAGGDRQQGPSTSVLSQTQLPGDSDLAQAPCRVPSPSLPHTCCLWGDVCGVIQTLGAQRLVWLRPSRDTGFAGNVDRRRPRERSRS